LSKHKTLINCGKKSIKLTTSEGKELEFIAEPVVTAKGVANRAKVNQLGASQGPEMLMASKFPDVDENITLSDTHNPPPLLIQGPITRARARQLNQQVSSFQSSSACTYENSMLPNEIIDYIVLRNFGEDHEGLGNQQGQGGRLGGRPSRWRPKSSLSQPSRTPGPACTKFISQPQTDSDFSNPHMPGKIKT
jgi:hypothetical protein